MTPVELRPQTCDLLASYYLAKLAVIEAGFEHEISWQERRRLDEVDETLFLREAAWVVLSSEMRESVIRRIFPAIESAFGHWRSAAWIVEHGSECKTRAKQAFRHEGIRGRTSRACGTTSRFSVSTSRGKSDSPACPARSSSKRTDDFAWSIARDLRARSTSATCCPAGPGGERDK